METMAKPVNSIFTVPIEKAEIFATGKMNQATKQKILLKASKVKRHTKISGKR